MCKTNFHFSMREVELSFSLYNKFFLVNTLEKLLTQLYNRHIKRDSKPYWFAPIGLSYFKTTVAAIQWFFHA